ncbi:MAG: diguanylate cyclase, partial [Campylobacterota bacterium]
LVEDNRSLAKLVAKKIHDSLEVTIDVAYTMAEAKEYIGANEYFLTLLDLNLPDAPNGEIVGYVYSKNLPMIVLTGSFDEQTREKILKKDVVDYVTKGSLKDVHYIVAKIQRLLENRRHKVLVVDDSQMQRRRIVKLLKNQMFAVIEAVDGEDALEKVRFEGDIPMVITDYNMPKMDGFELTLALRELYDKNQMAIIAVSSDESQLVSSKFLKYGATDFLKKPFSAEEFNCRVNNTIENLENIETIQNMANKDYMTGCFNRRYFFEKVEPMYAKNKETNQAMAIAMLDIDKFKNVNDTYGHDVGDDVIIALAHKLQDSIKGSDMVARFGGEEFCVVLQDIGSESAFDIFERLRYEIGTMEIDIGKQQPLHFTVSIGVTTAFADTLDEAINQADMLLYKAKTGGRNKVVLNG